MNWDEKTAAALNDEPQITMIHPVHQIDPDEPDPGPPPAPTPEQLVEPLHIAVIGSVEWDQPIVVQAVLLTWAQHHAGVRVFVWTTDAPDGAEQQAREHAERNGWTHVSMTPEQILTKAPVATFAFVKVGSEAEEFAREVGTRRPIQILTSETVKPRTRWSQW